MSAPRDPASPVYRATPAAHVQAELGESPLWDPDIGLRWLDVNSRRLHTCDPAGVERSTALSDMVTAVELGPARELLAVTSTGFGWLDPDTGRIDQITLTITEPTVTMNDAAVDARGRCWAGSAVRNGSWRGVLYCLKGTSATEHLNTIGMSNGIDWSPAGDVLYHVDSTAGTVTAWDYDVETGQLGESRVLRRVPTEVGLPDGLTVDAGGDVWLAVWGSGQVWRLDPSTGKTTAVVEVPTPYPTSCSYGGPDMSTLFITTANHEHPPGGGLLYAVHTPVRGRHPHRFSGTR